MATQLPEVEQWTTILLSAGRHHKHLMSPEMDEGESLALSPVLKTGSIFFVPFHNTASFYL